MSRNRIQLRLAIASFLGLSGLLISGRAIAQPIPPEPAHLESATAVRSGHDCYDLATEQPAPLGDFRQAALETAIIAARASKRVEEESRALVDLSEGYACLGDVEGALVLAAEARMVIEEIEDESARGALLVDIVEVYQQVGAVERRDRLMAEAVALIETLPQDSESQFFLINKLATQYVRMGEYENARDIIDRIENSDYREMAIYGLNHLLLQDTYTEEEKSEIRKVFPELESFDRANNYVIAEAAQYPIIGWMQQLHRGMALVALSSDQPESIAEFISAQQLFIEELPDAYARSYAYVALGSSISEFSTSEQVITLLNLASQEANSLEDPTAPFGVAPYAYPMLVNPYPYYSLNNSLGLAFIEAGALERGLAIIRKSDNSPEQLIQQVIGLSAAYTLMDEEKSVRMIDLLIEAEVIARLLEEPEIYLLGIANEYAESEHFEQAQRLSEDMIAFVNSEKMSALELPRSRYILGELIRVLLKIGNYDQAIELAHNRAIELSDSTEHNYLTLRDVAIGLIKADQDSLAFHAVDLIDSSAYRVSVLIDLAREYEYLSRFEDAFDMAVEALSVAQTAEFSHDRYLRELTEDRSNADVHELSKVMRGDVVESVIYAFLNSDRIQDLLLLVEDETLRATLTAKISEIVYWDEYAVDIESAVDDADFDSVARQEAKEGDFQAAVEAIALMTSPYEQSQTLLNIAQCHADSTTVLERETQRLLEGIQQQYQ